MRKLLLLLLWAVSVSAQTTTPNLGLNKPNIGQTGWGNLINSNFDTLDTLAGHTVSINSSGAVLKSNCVTGTLMAVTSGTSGVTLTLPSASGSNMVCAFLKKDSASGSVTLNVAAGRGQTINSILSNYALNSQNQFVIIQAQAGNWVVIGSGPSASSTLAVPNNGAGTTLNTLTKFTSSPSTAVIASTSDTGGIIGIVTSGAGTTGRATITYSGPVSCVFDGATTANDYVQISSTVAGNCHDAGVSIPTASENIGQVLSTNASGGTYMIFLSPQITAAASIPSLSAISAASSSHTIANGNNPQTWNWAQTADSQSGITFGENIAATNGTLGNQYNVRVICLPGSTAVPLGISNSLSGSQTLPTLHITPTWNTTGVVDAGILENVTNTASGAGSLLLDLQVGGTSQLNVDKSGNTTMTGQLTGGLPSSSSFTALSTGTSLSSSQLNVLATAGASGITLTLPTAVGNNGKTWCVTRADTGAGNILMGTTSSQTIGGILNSGVGFSFTAQNQFACFQSDGSNWQVLKASTLQFDTSRYCTGLTGSDQTCIANALSAASSKNTVVVAPGTYAINSQISFSQNNIKLIAGSGSAVLQKKFNGDMMLVTGNDVVIDGLTFDGNQSGGFTGTDLDISQPANGVSVRKCIFKNANTNQLYIAGSSTTLVQNVRVVDNKFSGGLTRGIFAEINVKNLQILHNFVDVSTGGTGDSHGIAVHTTTTGTVIKNVTIAENTISGPSTNAFCVEVGDFVTDAISSTNPTNVNITGNNCILGGNNGASNQSLGGLSIDQAYDVAIHGNTVDCQLATGTAGCSIGIEAYGNYISIVGNTLNGAGQMVKGISLDHNTFSVVAGNVIKDVSQGVNNAVGINLFVSTANGSGNPNFADDNTVANNVVTICPTSNCTSQAVPICPATVNAGAAAPCTVAGLTESGTTVTIKTAAAHGFTGSPAITVSSPQCATGYSINATATVVDANTLTYTAAGGLASCGAGVVFLQSATGTRTQTGTQYGIWVQCSVTGSDCSRNQITNNKLFGNGGAFLGVELENDDATAPLPTFNNNVVRSNVIDAYVSGATGVSRDPGATSSTETNTRLVNNNFGPNITTPYALTNPTRVTNEQIAGVLESTASITPSAVAANVCSDQTFAVTPTGVVKSGTRVGDVAPPSALGNLTMSAYGSSADTINFHFCNPSVASVTPPAGVYTFTTVQ